MKTVIERDVNSDGQYSWEELEHSRKRKSSGKVGGVKLMGERRERERKLFFV